MFTGFFDQNSGHTAFTDNALSAKKMNVKPGGAQQKCRILTGVGNYREWCIQMAHQILVIQLLLIMH